MYIKIPEDNEPKSPSRINAFGLLSSYPVIENRIIPNMIPIGVVTENIKHIYAVVPILNPACINQIKKMLHDDFVMLQLTVSVYQTRTETVLDLRNRSRWTAKIKTIQSTK